MLGVIADRKALLIAAHIFTKKIIFLGFVHFYSKALAQKPTILYSRL